MHRRTLFGVSQLLMSALFAVQAVRMPGYVSLLGGVSALCMAGIGVGIVTGTIESTIPDDELNDLERRVVLTALTVGVLAFAGMLSLLVL